MRSPVPTHGLSLAARRPRPITACIVIIAAVAWAQAADLPAPRPLESTGRDLVRATFRYNPAIQEQIDDKILMDPNVVQMPKVTVTDSRLQVLLERLLDTRKRAALENRPGFVNGVTFRTGSIRGLPTGAGVMRWDEVLKDEAKFRPDGAQVARWDVFKVQF